MISYSYVSSPGDLHFDTHWAISSMELLYAKGILRQHLVHSFPCGLSVNFSIHQPTIHPSTKVTLGSSVRNQQNLSLLNIFQKSMKHKKHMKTPKHLSKKLSKICKISQKSPENLPKIGKSPRNRKKKVTPGLHPASGRLHLRLSWPPGTQNCLDGLRQKAEIYTTIYTLNVMNIYIYIYMVLVCLIIDCFLLISVFFCLFVVF